MSRTPSQPEWDEERLDAAFRARFDVAAPDGLADRIRAATAAAGRSARFAWFALRGVPALGSAAVAALAVVAVAVVALNGVVRPPTTSPTASPGSGAVASVVPAATRAAESIPTSITAPGGSEAQQVLTVEEAIATRSTDQLGQELAVGGWYEMNAVPCPMYPDATSELEDCAINFTWLLQDPEQLSVRNTDGSGEIRPPTGPGINLVLAFITWTPPAANGPTPIVVTGHFNDSRADQCPAGDRRLRCQSLFVVDSVLWTGAPGN